MTLVFHTIYKTNQELTVMAMRLLNKHLETHLINFGTYSEYILTCTCIYSIQVQCNQNVTPINYMHEKLEDKAQVSPKTSVHQTTCIHYMYMYM